MKTDLRITRNMLIHWILLISLAVLMYQFGWIALIFYPSFFLLTYVVAHATGFSLFDTQEMVERCYSYVDSFLKLQGSGVDLGFNFWDRPDVTNEEAQVRKWEYMFREIGLKPGDWLLDVGCGYGDWLNFAKGKGVHVLGLNISPEQAQAARDRYGIEVINMSISSFYNLLLHPEKPEHEKYKPLLGRFDVVTFMDTMEHYAPPHYKWFRKKQDRIYRDAFHMTELLTRPKGKVFISCLHTNGKKMGIYHKFCWYLLDGTMCGLYPHGEDGLVKNAPGFRLLFREDRTEDYRLSAVRASEGWQHGKFGYGLRKLEFWKSAIFFFLIDPFLFHHIFSQVFDAWMAFYGKDRYDPGYDPEKRKELSYVNLYMLLLQREPACINQAETAPIRHV